MQPVTSQHLCRDVAWTRPSTSLYHPVSAACVRSNLKVDTIHRLGKVAQTNRRQLQRASVLQQVTGSRSQDYFATDKRPVILFDGVCNLCNGAVDFLLNWDKKAIYRLAALQSNAGRDLLQQAGRAPDDLSSIVLIEPGQAYIKSEAVLRIGRRLNAPFYALGSLGLPVPSLVRDGVYDMVANNRYQVFGKTNSCRKCKQGFDERFIAD